MKKFHILIFGVIFFMATSLTQALPEIFYTNFARTTGGGLVLNSNVDVRITIFDGATEVYKETHAGITTDEFGLFTVPVGSGAPVIPFNNAMYDALIASNNLNIYAESDAGDGYRFIELRSLLNTALRNAEVQGIVTLQSAYDAGNEIEVVVGFPVDLTGTGLIQSAASVADINTNGPSTLTTKQYVDDAIAAIFPLPHITEGDAIEILPDGYYDGQTTQSIGVADNSISNVKIHDNTEFQEVEALGDGFAEGFDVGSWSVTNSNRVLKFAGVGLTNVTRDGNTVLIDGSDNWGMQVVESDATLIGDGTIGNELGVNQDFPFVWTSYHQFIPDTDEPAIALDGSSSLTNPTLIAFGNADPTVVDFMFDGEMVLLGTNDTDANAELTVYGSTQILGVAGDVQPELFVIGDVVVSGSIDIDTDLNVDGATTLGGTLDVADNAVFAMDVNVQGNADVDGDLNADGATTLGGTLDVADNAVFAMDVNVQGNADVDGDLNADGATTLGGTLDVADNAVFAMDVNVQGNADVDGDLNADGATTLGGTLDVADNAVFAMDVNVQGNADVDGDLNADGATTLGGTLDVADNADFAMDVQIDGNLNVDGTSNLNGDVNLGDVSTDNVVFNAMVNSAVVPSMDNTYSLGTDANRWADVYVGPASLNIGTSGNNAVISYDLGNNWVDINTDLNVQGTVYGTTLNGAYTEGSVLFGAADGSITENNGELFWDDASSYLGIGTVAPSSKLHLVAPLDVALIIEGTQGDSNPDVLIDGEVLILGSVNGDAEFWMNGGDGMLLDGGASLHITNGDGILLDAGASMIIDDLGTLYVDGDGTFNNDLYVSNNLFVTNDGDFGNDVIVGNDLSVTGLATFENVMVNEFAESAKTGAEIAAEASDDLFVTKDYVQGGHFGSFNTLIAFNPASGPAITATSSDATAPTVTIENTHPDGTALQVQSNNASTTAFEIPTGNMSIGNGQLIVSANAGITSTPPEGQGPALIVGNFGTSGENGGAIFVTEGHTALSFNSFDETTTDYSEVTSTVIDINAGAAMVITDLPGTNVSADMPGTLLYIINSGTFTITLPDASTIPAGTVATFVNNGSAWFRIN